MENSDIYGKKACRLVKDLASSEPDQLSEFNTKTFDEVIKECSTHFSHFYELTRKMQDEGLDIQSARNSDHFGMLIRHLSLLRNKRCLMAYVHKRAQVIQSLSWKFKILPEEVEKKLSDSEKLLFKSHSMAIQSYTLEIDGLDLSVDMVPPKDPYIKVRVLDDLGVASMGDKYSNLACQSIHFLKRIDAEPYIFEGKMEELLG